MSGAVFRVEVPKRLGPAELDPCSGDIYYSVRRHFVDEFYTRHARELGRECRVLDLGGKKTRKRGQFDIGRFVERVTYANLDPRTEPDLVCDATSVPVEAGSFDAVILSEVVEHLPDPAACLRESSRVLATGGVLLAAAPFMYQVHADPIDVARYTPQWWERALPSAGYSEAVIEPQGMYLSVLADLLRAWACNLEERSAFYPGLRKPAFKFVQWVRETALEHEGKGHWSPGSFYANFTTGYGVRAVKG